jgi:NAD(P)-dependent dehydrogenase (short-subunit alcohol dehydrogenase family)
VEIRGSSALVTGAGRGIGRAVALALAKAGARVTAVARTSSDLESLAGEIRAAGGTVLVQTGDVQQRSLSDGAVAAAVAAHGGLQILVNNAAVGHHAPLAETSDEDWDRVLGTNLTAVFRLTRAALPHLTKAALDHLARCLMLEVRHQGVKVTTIAPGSVDTGFGDAAGVPRADASWMLRSEDVAETILDLLRTRDDAHLSRVEMRPLRPKSR